MRNETDKLNSQETEDATRPHDALRISFEEAATVPDHCRLIVERILKIEVKGRKTYSIMATPCDVEALAVGSAFAAGLISASRDIGSVHRSNRDPYRVRIRLAEPVRLTEGRGSKVTDSTMLCTPDSFDQIVSSLGTCADTLRIDVATLRAIAQKMRSRQDLFSRTGGAHAAAIFSSAGEILGFAEDIGRHNAVDKAIGKCLLEHRPTYGAGVMTSGRISFELVTKAARAEIELIAGVSAPSSLAVEAAEQLNITVCGFVREGRATVYTHSRRILGVPGGEK